MADRLAPHRGQGQYYPSGVPPNFVPPTNATSIPSRPTRSVRRPVNRDDHQPSSSSLLAEGSSGSAAGPSRLGSAGGGRAAGPSSSGRHNPSPGHDNAGQTRANRLVQAIQQEEHQNGLRPGSAMSRHSASPTGSADERDDLSGTPGLINTQNTSPVLKKALKAFSSAGSQAATARANEKSREATRKRDPHKAPVGTNGEGNVPSAPGAGLGRGRRGAVGVQGESSRMRGATQQEVPSTPAFKEMERVLAQVANDWPELVPPTPEDRLEGNNVTVEEDETNAFDPVTLALSLVDSQADPERYRSFLATKESLSRSLNSSIQTHYRSFDASISSYNGLLLNLTFAQKNTGHLRSTLEEVRETLGKGRSELGVLEARRTELAEMDRILVSVETLKNVPDRLETLMSEKKFLAAAVLLMRSLRMVSRGDIMEIAATADLRAYFVSQETLMLDYLTEELHNHLYLKSFYTDARWKPHNPGQTDLPAFLVEVAPPSIFDYEKETSSSDAMRNQTRLGQFLAHLAQKPAEGPRIDETFEEGGSHIEILAPAPGEMSSLGMPKSSSRASVEGMTASSSTNSGLGGNASAEKRNSQNFRSGSVEFTNHANPEQDSFTYIEDILESLAYLGKLSVAMDSIAQRAPIEIYNLVEGTVVETDERNDSTRRNSLRIGRLGSSPKLLFSGTFPPSQSTAAYSLLVRSSMTTSSLSLDDTSLASLVHVNTEIIMDFFWTLFSKLDAVLQGFRVLYEVMARIVARKDFKDPTMTNKTGGLIYSLTDIWKPVQSEVQTLLHEYSVDEEYSSHSGRNPIASINEILRLGRPVRDSSRPLFKFSESDSKSSARRLKPYEDSLNKSLRASVPGLASSLAEGVANGLQTNLAFTNITSTSVPSTLVSNTNKRSTIIGRTHRMLVPPNTFSVDRLVKPTLKFLERAKVTLPEGLVAPIKDTPAREGAKNYSGLMDDETLERLARALTEYNKD